jgi:hypothetical protein
VDSYCFRDFILLDIPVRLMDGLLCIAIYHFMDILKER